MDRFRETFLAEADDVLSELELVLLELAERPQERALVDRAFRALHTLKGSAGMFGFDDVSGLAHEVETVFDRVRSGSLALTPALVDAGLAARDVVRSMLAGTLVPGAERALLEQLRAAAGAAPPVELRTARAAAPAGAAPGAPDGAAQRFRVRFTPAADELRRGTNPLRLLDELRDLGPCEVRADAGAVPDLDAIDPEACYLAWEIDLTTSRGAGAVADVFLFVDAGSVSIAALDEGGTADAGAAAGGAPGARAGDGSASAAPAAAAANATAPSAGRAGGSGGTVADQIRVSAERLDRLVDLVGEMVITQARLARAAHGPSPAELDAVLEQVERLTSDLRDSALGLRMLPLATTFTRYRRLVRELGAQLGKQVTFETEGGETELDRSVLEPLGDALVHLVRNAVDHGIEPTPARLAASKPPQGTVRLRGRQQEGRVVIEVEDDGAGLDPEAIRRKAVERGLLAPDARPSERELFELVLEPGFSTARAVTNVSGRGVGMDVVRRAVEALRGRLTLSSVPGRGTTIRLSLPLTLAIIDGLVVRFAAERCVLPLAAVREVVALPADQRQVGRRLVPVRGRLVPYLRLREWFGADGPRPASEQVVVAEIDGEPFGFAVDAVVGHEQAVMKGLGRIYAGQPGLAGATILADGAVALILDLPGIAAGALATAQAA